MASLSDFVGSVVGESQTKTNTMLEKARGKVLVIDEAYNLDDKLYGKQVRSRAFHCAFLLIYIFSGTIAYHFLLSASTILLIKLYSNDFNDLN